MARVTMKTVADRLGVSAMTVSNAYSRPDQLSPGLRERIFAVAAELGYAGPDPAARSLVRRTTSTVGILRSESPQYAFHDEHSAIWLASLADELGRAGFALTLLPTRPTGSFVPARDVAMDGAIVHSCQPAADGVGWLRRRGLPLVYVDQAGESGACCVNIDDRGGAESAARHVVELGHRHIALLPLGRDGHAEPADWFVARQRLAGWQAVLDGAGIAPVLVHTHSSTVEDGARAAAAVLSASDPPTALLCFSDAVAAGALQAATARGLEVPTDVSIVGFDDTPSAGRMRPALTSVHQDITGKGRAAATMLVNSIRRHRNGSGDAEYTLLPTSLVVRDSTAPPRERRAEV